MKLFPFLSGRKVAAFFEDLLWRVSIVSSFFWNDPHRLFFSGVFPALHLTTLGLLLVLAVQIQDNKGLYFTHVALLHRLAYKNVCTRRYVNGVCAEMETLQESAFLRGKYILSYIHDQVESIFPENIPVQSCLKHTDLVGNLTIRQYRVSPRPVDSVLPGASASPEWDEKIQDLSPPDPNIGVISYEHTRKFRSKTTTYGSTPQALVLLTPKEVMDANTPNVKRLTLGRVKTLQEKSWVDGNSRAVIVDVAFHKQDDNVFVQLSLVYEKLGDYWKFSTKFLGARLTTYFFYPDEYAIQQFVQTDKRLFVDKRAHFISALLPTLLVITLIELVFETPHIWRLQFFRQGLRVFLLNVVQVALQVVTIKWAYHSSMHLKRAVEENFGNFYNMDVYPLLRSALWLTNAIIVQLFVHMLKQVYMTSYFHPVIDDLLRRLRTVVPVLLRMMFLLTILLLPFGAVLVSREGRGSLIRCTLELFSAVITGPERQNYPLLYYPLVILFLFILIPLMISIIVEGADEPNVQQTEVVRGPVTPAQLRRLRLRAEVRLMMENFLGRETK